MVIALVGAVGNAPAQIKNAVGFEDGEQPADRVEDLRPAQVHDHRLAQHVVERRIGNAGEVRQHGGGKRQPRIAKPRLFEQRIGGVVADRVVAAGGEEGDLAAAAAADVGGAAAGMEETFDQGMQIGWRRLRVPVLGKFFGAGVIGAERFRVHRPSPQPQCRKQPHIATLIRCPT